MKQLILFDGECHFCDKSIQFIIKRDPQAAFHFASLHSEFGRDMLEKYQLPKDLNTMILIANSKVYTKSDAALQIARQLKGAWKLCYVFSIIPLPIRDFVYDIVANNRYKWFGKKTSCAIPSAEVRSRFRDS